MTQHGTNRGGNIRVGGRYCSPGRGRHAIVLATSRSWAGYEVIEFIMTEDGRTSSVQRSDPATFASVYFVQASDVHPTPKALVAEYERLVRERAGTPAPAMEG